MLEARATAEPVTDNVRAFPVAIHRRALAEDRAYWRDRCRRAEAAMRGSEWNLRLYPFTLYETRILRLLARHESCSNELFLTALYDGHRDIEPSIKSIRTLITRARSRLPRKIRIEAIASFGYHTPHRNALARHLDSLKVAPDRMSKHRRASVKRS
jgi:hypothetical protein